MIIIFNTVTLLKGRGSMRQRFSKCCGKRHPVDGNGHWPLTRMEDTPRDRLSVIALSKLFVACVAARPAVTLLSGCFEC
jgi:hypothetical protein